MINQCDVGIVLVGVARLHGISVMRKHQRKSIPTLSQFLQEGFAILHFNPISSHQRLDQMNTVEKER